MNWHGNSLKKYDPETQRHDYTRESYTNAKTCQSWFQISRFYQVLRHPNTILSLQYHGRYCWLADILATDVDDTDTKTYLPISLSLSISRF